MKKITVLMLFLSLSLMLLSGCGKEQKIEQELKEEVKEDIVKNQIVEDATTEIQEKTKVPELTESDLKYLDQDKFNESQQDYEDELDNFLSDGEKEEEVNEEEIEDENIDEEINEDENEKEIEENNEEEIEEDNIKEQKQEKQTKNKEKSTTKENNSTQKKTNETTTNKNQQTKNKNVSTKNKTTIKEQLELKVQNKEKQCKKKGGVYNKSQDLCYKVIELE